MQKLIISGGNPLRGTIKISGSKNATLPILAASILNNKKITLTNIPIVKDVETMVQLLKVLGSKIKTDKKKKKIYILNEKNLKTFAPYNLLRTMRAGIVVLGPLLAKFGKAKVSLPGGCAIGSRPIDLHLFALKKMGASIKIQNGYINAKAKEGLKGCKINFPKVSVGATENTLIAASYASGTTTITNCAIEPEVKDLVLFLKKMGAKIKWKKKRTLIIEGTKKLKSVKHKVMFDRIEAGTFVIAAALTKGNLKIMNINLKDMQTEIKFLKKIGVKIKSKGNFIIVSRANKFYPIYIKTKPYPGFPTDLQAQVMVLMSFADGTSIIKENIFENRFMHVFEMNRMGTDIKINGNKAYIKGIKNLNGAEVMATDLRASVSLVLAALTTKSETTVNRVYHLDRGYEKIEKKLSNCGAKIKRIK